MTHNAADQLDDAKRARKIALQQQARAAAQAQANRDRSTDPRLL